MNPEIYYIELHLAQIADEMSRINAKVDSDHYDNDKIMKYISTLNDIVTGLLQIDLNTQSDTEKCQIKEILIFVSRCIQYIKSATKFDLRPTLYVCLRTALEDWVDAPKDYVLTSYKANVDSHHFLHVTVTSQAINMIQDILGITIPYKLVSLGYPTYLEKDFLSNVSLYHELGHFVDLCVWNISQYLVEIFRLKGIPMQSDYFQNINEGILNEDEKQPYVKRERIRLYNMVSEYFADIFAVQYIGRHKLHLSNYIAGDNNFSDSHPSTAARTKAILNFLGPEDQYDDFIKTLRRVTQIVSCRELKKRNAPLSDAPLLAGQAYPDISKEQVPTLFHNAWEIWETNKSDFKNKPEPLSAYKTLNDLLDQSMMNFLAKKNT